MSWGILGEHQVTQAPGGRPCLCQPEPRRFTCLLMSVQTLCSWMPGSEGGYLLPASPRSSPGPPPSRSVLGALERRGSVRPCGSQALRDRAGAGPTFCGPDPGWRRAALATCRVRGIAEAWRACRIVFCFLTQEKRADPPWEDPLLFSFLIHRISLAFAQQPLTWGGSGDPRLTGVAFSLKMVGTQWGPGVDTLVL